jgi:hypothetical protein
MGRFALGPRANLLRVGRIPVGQVGGEGGAVVGRKGAYGDGDGPRSTVEVDGRGDFDNQQALLVAG